MNTSYAEPRGARTPTRLSAASSPGSDALHERLCRVPLSHGDEPTDDNNSVLELLVLWGDHVLDLAQVSEHRRVEVGPRRRDDLSLDGLFPADRFAIARHDGGEAQVLVPREAQFWLRCADGSIDCSRAWELDDPSRFARDSELEAPFPARTIRLKRGERLVYGMGAVTVVAQLVRGAPALAQPLALDWDYSRSLAVSGLLHVFLVVAALITPDGAAGLFDRVPKHRPGWLSEKLRAAKVEPPPKLIARLGNRAKPKGVEGRVGDPALEKRDAAPSKRGAPRVDPNQREEDRREALNAGLLRQIRAGGSDAISNVFGPGGLGTGINTALGGLRGTALTSAGGVGGLGSRGTGSGGGGDSLAIGGIWGRGGPGGDGDVKLGGGGRRKVVVENQRTILQGGLTNSEVGRVIHRNLARFKWCYEKKLNSNPNLGGKISVYFTIVPTGAVANPAVRETSMGDDEVERCVVGVMRSLEFPKPRGGGIVVVTYPFVFAST